VKAAVVCGSVLLVAGLLVLRILYRQV